MNITAHRRAMLTALAMERDFVYTEKLVGVTNKPQFVLHQLMKANLVETEYIFQRGQMWRITDAGRAALAAVQQP